MVDPAEAHSIQMVIPEEDLGRLLFGGLDEKNQPDATTTEMLAELRKRLGIEGVAPAARNLEALGITPAEVADQAGRVLIEHNPDVNEKQLEHVMNVRDLIGKLAEEQGQPDNLRTLYDKIGSIALAFIIRGDTASLDVQSPEALRSAFSKLVDIAGTNMPHNYLKDEPHFREAFTALNVRAARTFRM